MVEPKRWWRKLPTFDATNRLREQLDQRLVQRRNRSRVALFIDEKAHTYRFVRTCDQIYLNLLDENKYTCTIFGALQWPSERELLLATALRFHNQKD